MENKRNNPLRQMVIELLAASVVHEDHIKLLINILNQTNKDVQNLQETTQKLGEELEALKNLK